MIRSQFNLYSNQRITSFKMTGHAESGPYGQDIVCAAVSALSISTVNGLEQVVHTKPHLKQDNDNGGFLEVTGLDLGHDSQILLKTFLNGLCDIQESYPQNIEVKMFD